LIAISSGSVATVLELRGGVIGSLQAEISAAIDPMQKNFVIQHDIIFLSPLLALALYSNVKESTFDFEGC
jgi:hypothetical protein